MNVDKKDSVAPFKLHELRCFEAVARLGSFQAAATALHRTHPSVFAAVARLEEATGLALFDRSGYRVALTDAGRMFNARAMASLREIDNLGDYARQLAQGEEAQLRIVLGDLCPRPRVLAALSAFFGERPGTRLHLDYEAVSGPFERLYDGSADLVFHRADPSRSGLEQIALQRIRLLPVAAPGLLPFDDGDALTPARLQPFTQCVLSDSARQARAEDHFLVDGAPRCLVPDHAMKKELILHRLAWGHLPDFMIEDELRSGALIDLSNPHLPGREETFAAIRRGDRPHGPVAQALWRHLAEALRG
ncbi:LysR family transcriptional regulator [Marilutibacter maris]|uniref:LysR family transcriptional regulator n=1 Tax=Marilutibacter maris TaxID=1605891 RepID=UPI001CB96384|nr:LysR family transcriptional regulator [Lysobacter maris]